jgi:outer membrane protein
MSRNVHPALAALPHAALLALLANTTNAAAADEAPPPPPRLNYVLGASVSSAPEYAGAARNQSGLKPMWALQYGRWRISTSGAGQVLGFGEEVQGPGASTELIHGKALRLGVALRMDSGRKSGDSDALRGLPDVKRTLRGRVFASYAITPQWLASATWSQDLLGRGGGGQLGADIGYRLRLSPRTEWTAGAGLSAGSARYMQSYFGVSDAASVSSGLPAYAPGAGLRDAHAGIGFTHALSGRWLVFGSAGGSRLLGDAAQSPFVRQRDGQAVAIGLAYRCCRWASD